MKKILLIIGFCLLVIGLSLLLIFYSPNFSFKKVPVSAVCFKISNGMSFDEIVNELKSKSLIQSKVIFKIYSFIIGSANKFKPGKYILKSNFSIFDFAAISMSTLPF